MNRVFACDCALSLSWLVFLPLVGALLALFVPRGRDAAAKTLGLLVAVLELVLAAGVLSGFDATSASFQFVESRRWMTALGIRYELGIDGISLGLVLLTALLTPVVLLASWKSIRTHVKEYVIAFLVLETGMMGALLATDLFLFYVFWEVMLIPMYLIIGIWGGARRIYASVKFFIFTMAGSLFMFLAIIYMIVAHWRQFGAYSFALADLARVDFSFAEQSWLFLAFALSFAIKVPLFPFHTWLPDAHVEAPTGGSIILAGVLLKMGTYGFLRFALPLFPAAAIEYTPLISALALIGIVYGALVAMVQKDMKKLVAYSSVSHLGFIMLGIFAAAGALTAMGAPNVEAAQGALLQMINHGLSTGALFLLVGALYERRHSRMIADMGGIAARVPVFTALFLIVTFSSIGLPGLNGFAGEFLILLGTYQWSPVSAAIAATGVILSAVYMLWMIERVFFGPLRHEENKRLDDIGWHEVIALAPLLVFIVWIGVSPQTFLSKSEVSVRALLAGCKARLTPSTSRERPHRAVIAATQEHAQESE